MEGAEVDALFQTARRLHLEGRLEDAILCLDRVLTFRPDLADAWNNRGVALDQLGRANEAIQSFDRAASFRPQFFEALNNRGNALKSVGRTEEALESFDRALAVRPDIAATWCSRANALKALGRAAEALESLDRSLALKPDVAETWNDRGVMLNLLKRPADALQSLARALELRPDFAEALNNRGAALNDLRRADDAVQSLDRALALRPDLADALNNRGVALNALKRHAEALEDLDRAVALRPDSADAWNTRGAALKDLGRPEEAIESLDRALTFRADFAKAWNNRGVALNELGRFDEALADYDRAIALDPRYLDASFNQSLTRLLLADLGGGWPPYELRKLKDIPVANRAYDRPLLSPETRRKGAAVLVHAEQGLGDTIQFCRYIPMLEDLGMKVAFAPQPALGALMSGLSPTVDIVDADDKALQFDYHAPLMSLPLIFGTTLETIPAPVPYLRATPAHASRWNRRIGMDGFRIGVSWRGSRTLQGRDFSPDLLRPLAAAPGVRLIRLQNDDDAAFDAHPGLEIERLEGLDAGPDAFLDTAAVMETLDLVITCDTAIAHLAGALGRPTWVALKHVPDWRWLLDRTDSPWYPTMRLFRQKTRGDWGPVFEEMAGALRERLAAQAPASSLPPS